MMDLRCLQEILNRQIDSSNMRQYFHGVLFIRTTILRNSEVILRME